jgi:hypothetical protein
MKSKFTGKHILQPQMWKFQPEYLRGRKIFVLFATENAIQISVNGTFSNRSGPVSALVTLRICEDRVE